MKGSTQYSIALTASYLAVGAYQEGTVYMYSCTLSTPTCSTTAFALTITSGSTYEFGYAVSSFNGVLMVSAPAQGNGRTFVAR
jgi:hypothetical protein